MCKKEIINDVVNLKPILWINKKRKNVEDCMGNINIKFSEVIDAEKRFERFAPFIKKIFPETVDGIIESPLIEIDNYKKISQKINGQKIDGRLFIKCDSHLKVAGSVKARGGFYEILKLTEDIAIKNNIINYEQDYSKLCEPEYKKIFSQYTISVGSTGNLGMSIGILSSAIGYKVTVHMSRDAKEWKKRLLRQKGVKVVEHKGDIGEAYMVGRKECEKAEYSYFVDDEDSKHLFLGYSVAALRLKRQLETIGVKIGKTHPLYVYIPCGVGGAAGGITFGLKNIYGNNVYCYCAEPTHSPSMLLGLATGKMNGMHVNEYGIDNITQADGLAVGSPSKFVSGIMEYLLDGVYTIQDNELYKFLSLIKDTENLKIEPSAAASLQGPYYFADISQALHICWATGGMLIPEDIYNEMYNTGKKQLMLL